MSKINPTSLLAEFREEIVDSGRKRKEALVESLGLVWEYLVKTPGEQMPYNEYGRLFGTNGKNAYSRLKTLANAGVIKKTSGGKGAEGVGFICEWLEARRRGDQAKPAESTDEDVAESLNSIEDLAERCVQSVRRQFSDQRTSLAVIQALREIQASTSRALAVLVDV